MESKDPISLECDEDMGAIQDDLSKKRHNLEGADGRGDDIEEEEEEEVVTPEPYQRMAVCLFTRRFGPGQFVLVKSVEESQGGAALYTMQNSAGDGHVYTLAFLHRFNKKLYFKSMDTNKNYVSIWTNWPDVEESPGGMVIRQKLEQEDKAPEPFPIPDLFHPDPAWK